MNSLPETSVVVNYGKVSDAPFPLKELGLLWNMRRKTDVECRIKIGRIYNRYDMGSGQTYHDMKEMYGEDLRRQFRGCAWVAAKWTDADMREKQHAGKAWSYYRDNTPGGIQETVPSKRLPVIRLDDETPEVIDDQLIFKARNRKGDTIAEIVITLPVLERMSRIAALLSPERKPE